MMAEIAVDACHKAMAAAGKGLNIDAVICGASNMQRAYPAVAVEIQQALGGGLRFRHERGLLNRHLRAGTGGQRHPCGSAKVRAGGQPEITSAHQEWRDRDCHFIFGDVATATIVESADTATSADQWEVLGTKLAPSSRTTFATTSVPEPLRRPPTRTPATKPSVKKVAGVQEVVPIAAAHIEGHLGPCRWSPLKCVATGCASQPEHEPIGGQAPDWRQAALMWHR